MNNQEILKLKKEKEQEILKNIKNASSWNNIYTAPLLVRNGLTKNLYKGKNIALLNFQNIKSSVFFTFNQLQDYNKEQKTSYHIKKGEKASKIIYYNFIEKNEEKDGKEEKKTIPFLKCYNVFGTNQIEGWFEGFTTKNDDIDKIIKYYCNNNDIMISYGDAVSHYNQSDNSIIINNSIKNNASKNNASELSCIFHEMGHSAKDKENKEKREKEELIAEFTALFIMEHLNEATNETTQNSFNYIKSWSRELEDKDIIDAYYKAIDRANKILDNN